MTRDSRPREAPAGAGSASAFVYGERTWPWRLGFTIVLGAAMAASTWYTSIFSVLAPFLLDDLGISRSQLGLLITATAGMAAILSLSAGRLTDALGGRTVMLGLFGSSAVITLLMAMSPSYGVLAVAAVFAGVSSAASNPGTNKVIATLVPRGRRGVVMGIKQSGVQAGIFVSAAALPGAAVAFGWRVAVGLVAVVALAGLIIAARLLPPRERDSAETLSTLRYRNSSAVRWISLYAFLMGAGVSSTTGFLPLYAHEEVGLSVTKAGWAAALVGLVGIGARIVWGRATEHVAHVATPLAVLATCSVGSGVFIWMAADRAWVLWVGVVSAGLTLAAWNSVAMLAAVSDVPTHYAGRVTGMVQFGFMAGFTSSPALFGYLVDRTGNYDTGWALVIALFAAGASVMWAWRWSSAGRRVAHSRTQV